MNKDCNEAEFSERSDRNGGRRCVGVGGDLIVSDRCFAFQCNRRVKDGRVWEQGKSLKRDHGVRGVGVF